MRDRKRERKGETERKIKEEW